MVARSAAAAQNSKPRRCRCPALRLDAPVSCCCWSRQPEMAQEVAPELPRQLMSAGWRWFVRPLRPVTRPPHLWCSRPARPSRLHRPQDLAKTRSRQTPGRTRPWGWSAWRHSRQCRRPPRTRGARVRWQGIWSWSFLRSIAQPQQLPYLQPKSGSRLEPVIQAQFTRTGPGRGCGPGVTPVHNQRPDLQTPRPHGRMASP